MRSGAISVVSLPTSMRTKLENDSGRIIVTAVVVRTTKRNTAKMTVLRILIIRQ